MTLVKNIISNNSTSSCGGGIALRWTEYHVLEGNLIESNQSETGGGVCFGLWANQGLMLDNDVKNNVSKFGGGVISSGNTEFHYNRFENNLVNGALNHFYNNSSQNTPNIDAETDFGGVVATQPRLNHRSITLPMIPHRVWSILSHFAMSLVNHRNH